MSEAVHEKMAKVLADFPIVGKEQSNPSQGYKYRGIDDALGHVHGLLKKHGLYMLLTDLEPEFSSAGKTKAGKEQVRCVVTGKVRFVAGEDGSSVEASLIGEGIDTGDKAMMKAQANGLKYVLWYTFAVPTDEVKDSEGYEDPEPAKAPPKRTKKTTKKSAKDELIKRIKACSTLEELEAIKPEAREACSSYGEGASEYEEIADAVFGKQQELAS